MADLPTTGTSGPAAGSVGGSGSGTAVSPVNPWEGTPDPTTQSSSTSSTTPATTQTTQTTPAVQPQQQTQQTTQQTDQSQQSTEPQLDANGQPITQPQTQTQAQPQLTAEQITMLAATAAQQLLSQQTQQTAQQTAQPQMTPEEMERQFNIVKPTEQDVSAIFAGGTAAVDTLQRLLHGSAKMATTISMFAVKGMMEKFRQEIGAQLQPVQQSAQKQLMDHHTTQFYGKFPELAPDATSGRDYTPILMSAYNHLEKSGFRGTPEQVYQKVAEEAKRLITAVNPQAFAASQNGQVPRQQVQQQGASRMAALPTSAGSGGATSPAGGKGIAEKLFG